MTKIIVNVNPYHESFAKRAFDLTLSILGMIISLPIFFVVSMLILSTSGFPIFFVQKRVGLNGSRFRIIKFRTMKVGMGGNAKYKNLNEADGPVFKIFNDPRFTSFGRILSRCGLDELPQLINVAKGEMSLVGPRPLPHEEAKKLSVSQKVREQVKPGMTSPWVINGAHHLSFSKWMSLDKNYVKTASLSGDIGIIVKTFIILIS